MSFTISMSAFLSFLSEIRRWLGSSGSEAQILLGVMFSFNTGLALLKKFKEDLNTRLLSAVRVEIETARNAGWLGDLSIIDKMSSAGFRCAVRSLVVERDKLESGEYPFVVWSARITRTLMLISATIALVCMVVPCTARWTVLLIIPYPIYVLVSMVYEGRKVKAFEKMRTKVKAEYELLPVGDKNLIAKNRIYTKDIDNKLNGARKTAAGKIRASVSGRRYKEGVKDGKIEAARKLKAMKLTLKQIATATDLSADEIDVL